MLASSVAITLLMAFVLAVFVIGGCAFVVMLIGSIKSGRFRWQNRGSPVYSITERSKNPIAFWLSFVPFIFLLVAIVYVICNIILELWRGTAK